MLLIRTPEVHYSRDSEGRETIEINISNEHQRITNGEERKASEKYASDNKDKYINLWKPIGTHDQPIERLRIATPELPLTTLGAGGLVSLTYTDSKGNKTQEVTGIVRGAGAPSYPNYLTIASGLPENLDEILDPTKLAVREALGEETLVTLTTGKSRFERYRGNSAIAYLYCPEFPNPKPVDPVLIELNNLIRKGIEERAEKFFPGYEIQSIKAEIVPLTPTQTLVVNNLDTGRQTITAGGYLHFDPTIGDINWIANFNLTIPPEHLAIPTRSISIVDGEKPHGEDRIIFRSAPDGLLRDLVNAPNSKMTPHLKQAVRHFYERQIYAK